jgi:hypothetical protein
VSTVELKAQVNARSRSIDNTVILEGQRTSGILRLAQRVPRNQH